MDDRRTPVLRDWPPLNPCLPVCEHLRRRKADSHRRIGRSGGRIGRRWNGCANNLARDSQFTIHCFNDFADGDAVYRFFELFDLANVPNSKRILNWPPKNASASRRRPSRCSRRKCFLRCCGIATCTTSGGRTRRGLPGAFEKTGSLHLDR